MIRTRHHSVDWAEAFRAHVAQIPEVVDMHRIGGEWDYMLKIVARGMAGYDSVYRRLIAGADLETVTGYFSMETMLEDRLPDLSAPEPSGARARAKPARRSCRGGGGGAPGGAGLGTTAPTRVPRAAVLRDLRSNDP
jgi:hypothetical protein